MDFSFPIIDSNNIGYLENLYSKYKNNPNSVDYSWQLFFEKTDFQNENNYHLNSFSNGTAVSKNDIEVAVVKLIKGYRERGHLVADTNPIDIELKHRADLELEYFNLSKEDLKTRCMSAREIGMKPSTLETILFYLNKTYCSKIGCEFVYCQDERVRHWLYKEMEKSANDPQFSRDEKINAFKKINETYLLEQFLQKKYMGEKRFSIEGIEVLIPALFELIDVGAELGVKEFVFGMSHRGRLNVLVNIFNKTFKSLFVEFEGGNLPEGISADADVKYHLGQSADIKTVNGKDVHLSLTFNPSHLEAINPVVEGIVYGKCEKYYKGNKNEIVPLLIHGDAAVAGQGVVYETINMSRLKGYDNKGTIHIVLNNQIGFTADKTEARSSHYCTDIAKVVESPIFHVNADEPLAVLHVTRLAIKLRQAFNIDVWIDIIGYRRHGHNETDEPRFTQPILYQKIDKHLNVRDFFLKKLLKENVLSENEAREISEDYKKSLMNHLENLKQSENRELNIDHLKRHWIGIRFSADEDFKKSIKTGIKREVLNNIHKKILEVPKSFSLFKKMEKLLKQRRDRYLKQNKIDWAMAEQLAYGSLLVEGYSVRLSGQDCKRGTFAHRHAVIKDMDTEEEYIPLNHIQEDQRKISIYNSLLSEYGVLGFEYGYSLARPKALTIWEAQFGDFANGAQIVIDQFIISAKRKWLRLSGIVLYLPHGYEGQGPEHSSARLERFLSMCANNNIYVVVPTSADNFFHLIRRQILNEFRIPLVVFTPKSLLRHECIMASVDCFIKGNFLEVIDDKTANRSAIERVLLCTGKIYYELLSFQKENKNVGKTVAIIRIEQLYPLNIEFLKKIKDKYKKATKWIWVQEEPSNMGAWSYIKNALGDLLLLKCISRKESASTATGIAKRHHLNQKMIIEKAFLSKN